VAVGNLPVVEAGETFSTKQCFGVSALVPPVPVFLRLGGVFGTVLRCAGDTLKTAPPPSLHKRQLCRTVRREAGTCGLHNCYYVKAKKTVSGAVDDQ